MPIAKPAAAPPPAAGGKAAGESAAASPAPSPAPAVANGNGTPQKPPISAAAFDMKCIQCGNVARSQCSFQCCKACCYKAQNPCHIHVLKQTNILPDKPSPTTAPVSEQPSANSLLTSSVSRLASLQRLAHHFRSALLPKKSIVKKDVASINKWRFMKPKEHIQGDIDAENEAYERYTQNVGLLEETFCPTENATIELEAETTSSERMDILVSEAILRLKSDNESADSFKERVAAILDQKLKILESETASEDQSTYNQNADDHTEAVKLTTKQKMERTAKINELLGVKLHSNLLAMDVPPVSHSLSNLMLSSDEFEKHSDALPSIHIGPQLLHASMVDTSDTDDGYFCDMLDDNIMVPFEGGLVDDSIDEDALGVVERIGLVESLKRLSLGSPFDVPNESICYINFCPLPESSRDLRHVNDLRWHEYYRMNDISETTLPPKRYTNCDPSTKPNCFHEPSQVLQFFDMKLQPALLDMGSSVEVYGTVAVRDGEDYRRNYLFNRPRDNPLTINTVSDLLRLRSPKRAMSMKFNCLIEVDIRVKAASKDVEDYTLVDGCMEFLEYRVLFDTFFRCTMDGPYGVAIFDLIIYEFGVEATIELEFLKVPVVFEIQMCGYTLNEKMLYTFVDKNRECNSIISSVGKFLQHFVAAVKMDDILCIDFVDGGCPVLFKPAIHGSQSKEYHFMNGAIVSVTVSWSTTSYGA